MRNYAIAELTKAEALLSNWKWLPGSQVKVLVTHLVRALDAVASFVLEEPTIIEQSYLTLSSVRLFEDQELENEFYDTYYYLMSLLRKNIFRVNPRDIKIVGSKQIQIETKGFFEELIKKVKLVLDEAFEQSF